MDWDYIIVGAGSCGCAVAHELAASGDKRVLLLEAGGSDRSLRIRIPVSGAFVSMQNFDWGYHCEPDPTRNGQSEPWPRGRVVGGTSSINGMNHVRGSAADFDRWAALGNQGWDARSVMPLFAELERCDPSIAPSPIRGRKGHLHVRQARDCHPVTDAYLQAAQAAGFRVTSDYNGESQEGVGYSQMTQRGRSRWSAADAFLKPISRHKNFKLATRAHVLKLLVENRRVYGVRYEQGGRVHEACARDVILCAGAINTPQILMLSGVGDARALRGHGIDVIVDRIAVGQNLIEHPSVRLVYRMNRPTYNLTEGLGQKIQLLAKYLFKGQGPLACFFESNGFLRSTPEESEPDIQLHMAAFGFDVASEGTASPVQLLPYPSMRVSVTKTHPVSRSELRLRSADPKAAPRIVARLLEDDADLQTFIKGIKAVRRIMQARPISDWVSEEVRPGSRCDSDESLASYIRNNTELAYHPAGTCRMGVDDEAVVTPDLKVRGLEHLWIADASIMPDLISGNTNAICMVIGMKLGRYLLARERIANRVNAPRPSCASDV